MPLVYGVHMRWSVRKDPCSVCGKVDQERFMIEVERKDLLCPDCVEDFREKNRNENSDASGRPEDSSPR